MLIQQNSNTKEEFSGNGIEVDLLNQFSKPHVAFFPKVIPLKLFLALFRWV